MDWGDYKYLIVLITCVPLQLYLISNPNLIKSSSFFPKTHEWSRVGKKEELLIRFGLEMR